MLIQRWDQKKLGLMMEILKSKIFQVFFVLATFSLGRKSPTDKGPVDFDFLLKQSGPIQRFHGALGFFECLVLNQCVTLNNYVRNSTN